ncbi:MAG: phytanoyl-CoA dioxygenase family protein [Rhodobacteraceae bacterium]|nr:phytanoyl-CoA dioxygenase family protein [Paracoccaceae bacterium]
MLLKKRKLPQGIAIAAQSPEFWRRLVPDLTISESGPRRMLPRRPDTGADRMRLVNDGFLHLAQPGLGDALPDIAAGMRRIVAAGLPSAFVGVYDEVWDMLAGLDGVLDGLFDGKAALVPNFWASHGAPGTGAQRRRGGGGVFADGTPKNLTIWLPVTDATPANGCVYVVPAGQDRNYGSTARADASLPGIRALTAQAGDVLIWTGEIYHWQGRVDRHADASPLLALTWEFQSRDTAPLEQTLIDSFPHVPFETRLAILAGQMPRHRAEFAGQPVWRAVQQTLANRYPMPAMRQSA